MLSRAARAPLPSRPFSQHRIVTMTEARTARRRPPPRTSTSNRINLSTFVAVFGPGGTERQVVNLTRGLDVSRFGRHLACLRRSGLFLKDLEALQIPIAEYRIRRLYDLNALDQRLKFAGALRRDGIDIVHAYNFYANVFALPAARLAGVPVVVGSIRDTGDVWTPMQRRVHRLVCRLAHCVLVNAEAIRQALIRDGFDASRIRVIRNGIDLSRFPVRRADGDLRRQLGVSADAPVVLLLSRFSPLKGIDDFLAAAARLAGRLPEARFVLAGNRSVVKDGVVEEDAEYRRELERQVERLGLGRRVMLAGLREDVPELLSQATVSVLPSLSEGLSNVLLESMAAALPVVATRVGGNPEVVEDGVTGLLVPPRDPEALARSIGVLLENPGMSRRFGLAGRARVEKEFSVARMVRDTERLYTTLMAAR